MLVTFILFFVLSANEAETAMMFLSFVAALDSGNQTIKIMGNMKYADLTDRG